MPSKATDDPEGKPPFFGMLRVSDDMGTTWTYGGRIAEDPIAHFSEPAIHLSPGGKIIVLFRCHYRPPGTNGPFRLALVESTDGGVTWSPWRPTMVPGHPAHMLALRDGRIFLTVGARWPEVRGCTARVLEPEGSDLDSAAEIIVRGDSHDTDCGYPWAAELSDGRVLVVYYYVYPDGVRGIEGTVLEEA
jgi:hypothetical protein